MSKFNFVTFLTNLFVILILLNNGINLYESKINEIVLSTYEGYQLSVIEFL